MKKTAFFGRKSWLAGKVNQLNGKGIFIEEKLPKVQKEIQEHANSQRLITSTFNCNVKVFKKEENGSYKGETVNNIQAVDDIRKSVVLKVKHNHPQTPQQIRKQPAAIFSMGDCEPPGEVGAEQNPLRIVDDSHGNNSIVTASD